MKRMKISCIWVAFLSAVFIPAEKSYAQRSPVFTQYMFNGLVLNPAYTGSQESMMLTASVRSQWTGIKGAPQTQVFSAHAPIKFSRSAGGLVAVHDKAGVIGQTMLYGTYAYHLPVSPKGKISVGGQAGATYYQAELSALNIITQSNTTDPAFNGNESHLFPNLGIGAFYYTRITYIGFSIPAVINNKWNDGRQLENNTQQRHYFLTAGHVFSLNPDLKLKPNILLKWVEGGPFQYDINANLFIKKTLWVGLSYRMGDSIDGLFEWNINDQLAFGYSYGYPVNALAPAQWGTHEIVLNYRLKRDSHIIRSPRYF